jgi:hypothetical protein
MPKLPAAARGMPLVELGGLVSRDDSTSLLVRHPAMNQDADAAMAVNPLTVRQYEKREVVEGIIPSYYTVDGPSAGTVVGIVLGSVLGFLLLIWLFYSIANINNGNSANNAIAGEEEIVVRRPRHSQSGRSGRSRRSTHTDVREYSRSPRRRSQVIVEERRAPRPQRPRSIVVSERSRSRVPGDDIVEVFEEHEDYRERRGSRR